MNITVKQISSLEKVRRSDKGEYPVCQSRYALPGERICYQLYIHTDDQAVVHASARSELNGAVRLYRVRDVMMDAPVVIPTAMEDYITQEPGPMPDVLIPLEEMGHKLYVDKVPCAVWVRVDIPRDIRPGSYEVTLCLEFRRPGGAYVDSVRKTMELKVIPAVMPEQRLIYTRWLYLDCIATAHHVEVFSEGHWYLIERYIRAAADLGINMLMVPVHTPPLDTEVGTARPCVQLVDVEKTKTGYRFSFARFHRFIGLCKKYGIRYFEIAHMFTQWGAGATPNIMVTENGKTGYGFGWHVASDDPRYVEFLQQYIPAIVRELEKAGIADQTYFHVSDEPSVNDELSYRKAADLIRPLTVPCRSFDTLSEVDFYEKGLVETPVTLISSIHKFLEHPVDNQWVYYCCGPNEVYPNCFMAMPSYRVRILGFLLYRYNIKGFLHWGFNFYNAIRSLYPIDPYLTTSSDGAFPSGDPLIVYPAHNGVYTSIRGEVTFEAVQDMNICIALENLIGREQVERIIDQAAGKPLRFDDYPRSSEYILKLRETLLDRLAQQIGRDNES